METNQVYSVRPTRRLTRDRTPHAATKVFSRSNFAWKITFHGPPEHSHCKFVYKFAMVQPSSRLYPHCTNGNGTNKRKVCVMTLQDQPRNRPRSQHQNRSHRRRDDTFRAALERQPRRRVFQAVRGKQRDKLAPPTGTISRPSSMTLRTRLRRALANTPKGVGLGYALAAMGSFCGWTGVA